MSPTTTRHADHVLKSRLVDLTVGHIQALLAVDEHGSFTRAAGALGLTQSAVSRTIAALEHRLGGRLIHRGLDGASLTALGRQVAEHGVTWQPDHTVRDVSTVIAMVSAGITAGVVPALAAPLPTPRGVVLLPLHPPLHRTLYIHPQPHNQHVKTLTALLTRTSNQITGPNESPTEAKIQQ